MTDGSAAAARRSEAWRTLAGAPAAEGSLASRLCDAALLWSGARGAALYLRDREAWIRAASSGTIPSDAAPRGTLEARVRRDGILWLPLAADGDLHGQLALEGIDAADEEEVAGFLSFALGGQIAAHRLSRLVKEAEFEVRTRLLELESLYDLGLSLSGQLDLAALADEVLFRSISLTDAGKGTLVLFDGAGQMLFERSLGGELLPPVEFASWALPEGDAVINNAAASLPTAGARLSSCQKCLAVAISAQGRRLGVLAVADKESRDGGVLDFTSADARLLSLFAAQAAAAIETARLHREAIEKERIERELELAAAIQREILPRSLPEIPGLELAAANIPTRQVGGDYYDFFPLSRGRLGFVVADVSGKGVPAALLVSTVHAAVHLQIDEAKTIAELVGKIDRHLQRFAATRKFLTLFFGVIEPEEGVLRYVSAGHNPALLLRRSGETVRLDATGLPLGMLPASASGWKEEAVPIAPGDLLCVYTDGLTEAVDQAEEEFGFARLAATLERGSKLPAAALCERVFADVAEFASGVPQYDDQTLLLARRTSR